MSDQEVSKLVAILEKKLGKAVPARKPKLELVPTLPDETQFQAIDLSPRAVKMRAIVKIANANSWHSAIVHFMESRNAQYLSDLTDPQLDDLKDRMEGYVDAAEMGCSLADCLPAS